MGKIANGAGGKTPGRSLKETGQKGSNDTNNKKNADLMSRHANGPKI